MKLKTLLFTLMLTGPVVWPGAAFQAGAAPKASDRQSQPWHTPKPPYPPEVRVQGVGGSGIVRLETDAKGRMAKVVMEKSTGSRGLDESTVAFAKTNWTGPPDSAKSVPIIYRLDHPGTFRVNNKVGQGLAQVTFDRAGRAVAAKMEQSTGNKLLDDNTIKFALANWTGPSNSTRYVPILYQPAGTKPPTALPTVTPRPPYPIAAVKSRLHGNGVVQFTTDASGKAVRAVMQQSTGSGILDDNTVKWVLAQWYSSPNHTGQVPVNYQLQ